MAQWIKHVFLKHGAKSGTSKLTCKAEGPFVSTALSRQTQGFPRASWLASLTKLENTWRHLTSTSDLRMSVHMCPCTCIGVPIQNSYSHIQAHHTHTRTLKKPNYTILLETSWHHFEQLSLVTRLRSMRKKTFVGRGWWQWHWRFIGQVKHVAHVDIVFTIQEIMEIRKGRGLCTHVMCGDLVVLDPGHHAIQSLEKLKATVKV